MARLVTMSAKPDFRHIESCLAVTDDVIQEALAAARSMAEPTPRMKCLALIERMAEVAKPGRAAPKILVVLAHMALKDWLDGLLRVRLIGDPEVTVLELTVDDGLSSERIMGPVRIDVPFDEFRRSLEMRPEFVLPLVVEGELEERRVELATAPQSRHNTVPPAMSVVAESLIPMVGEQGRELPPIVSRIPESLPKDTPPQKPAKEPAVKQPGTPQPPPRRQPRQEGVARLQPGARRPPPPRRAPLPPPRMPTPAPLRPAKAPAAETAVAAQPERQVESQPGSVIAPPEEPTPKPELVIAPPEAPEPAVPEPSAPRASEPTPTGQPGEPQRRFKPVSLPPHMKEALSSIKKKS